MAKRKKKRKQMSNVQPVPNEVQEVKLQEKIISPQSTPKFFKTVFYKDKNKTGNNNNNYYYYYHNNKENKTKTKKVSNTKVYYQLLIGAA